MTKVIFDEQLISALSVLHGVRSSLLATWYRVLEYDDAMEYGSMKTILQECTEHNQYKYSDYRIQISCVDCTHNAYSSMQLFARITLKGTYIWSTVATVLARESVSSYCTA